MSYTIEYYDRTNNYHGIGTFRPVKKDEVLPQGTQFIVLPDHSRTNGKAGHCEGRADHPAYLKPLIMRVKRVVNNYTYPETGGAWSYDCCLVENE